MASDSKPSRRAKLGDNVQMSVSGHDSEKLTKASDGLADGGKVDMPLAKQLWGTRSVRSQTSTAFTGSST